MRGIRGLQQVPLLVTVLTLTLAGGLVAATQGGGERDYVPLAATSPSPQAGEPRATPAAEPTAAATAAPAPGATTTPPKGLTPEDACPPLLQWIRGEAEPLVTPYGLQGMSGGVTMIGAPERGDAAAPGDAAAGGSEGGTGGGDAVQDNSGTNVQEAGIDEPDIVKQDGGLLVAVTWGRLQIADVRSQPPRLLASLELPEGWNHQLLLRGKRLLVAATIADVHIYAERRMASGDGIVPGPVSPPQTSLTVYDLSDPADPAVVNRLKVDGSLVSAREQDGIVRAVVHAWTAPDFVMPADPEHEDEALARNREIVRTAPVVDWLPKVSIQRADGAWNHRTIVPCGSVLHPRETQDLSTVSVLTLDLREPGAILGSATVAGAGETVYASTGNVYVAQGPMWRPDGTALTPTIVHRFDTSDPRKPRYASTATVPGRPLNQWSLSEREGHLRIATTTDPVWDGDGAEQTQSSSSLHVFRIADGAMPEVGTVEGLGKGERIYAVRYVDQLAYVVTFRQVDPLYVIDLADPAKPHVVGELKIPGYSNYLHPIGGGYLVGVGQDADAQGVRTGFKASVFDVRDPADPKQVSSWSIGPNSGSEVEWDHHAFLWWAPTRRLVLPVEQWQQDRPGFVGAVSLAIGTDGAITEAGRVQPRDEGAPDYTPVRRALMNGANLLLMTDAGLVFADPDTLDARDWLGFPQPPQPDPRPMPIEDGPA